MLRIAHISDIHIRNFKYHAEYRETFARLYDSLEQLKPDLIVNTGDTAHSKLQISPELVQMIAEHFERSSRIAPYLLLLGNHDMNLHNLQRVDAISPIAAQFPKVRLLKKSEPVSCRSLGVNHDAVFWPFAMADSENYPTRSSWEAHGSPLNIGLFHGAVAGCVTDSEWTMSEAEHHIAMFDGLDFVLMGDIHKQQFFNGRRIGYAGSLVQQNFGESHDKGFLLWEISNRDEFEVQHVPLESPLKFRTVRANSDLIVHPAQTSSKNAYVRVLLPRVITSAEQKELISAVKQQFEAKEVICVLSPEAQDQRDRPVVDVDTDNVLNVRSLDAQESLIRAYLADREIDDEMVQRVVDLNKKLQTNAEEDEIARNSRWKINKIGWSNLFNYGESNVIDFSKIPGVTGIFGPNGIGKSSIFDVINEGLFDKVTKDVSKNIELINDNRDEARVVVDVELDGRDYVIERSISRIKYGQRKKDVKEWGRTDVDFYVVHDNERVELKGQSRPETERTIRKMLGTFEDFCLTTLSPQSSVSGLPGGGDIISCKETDRKKILFKFLDMEIFEKKAAAAKEMLRDLVTTLKYVSLDELRSEKDGYEEDINVSFPKKIKEWEDELAKSQNRLENALTEQERLRSEHDSIRVELCVPQRDPSVIESEISACSAELEKIRQTISRLSTEIPRWNLPIPEDVSDQVKEAEVFLAVSEKKLDALERKVKESSWKLNVLSEVPCGDSFPTCKFLIDAFTSRESLPGIRGEVAVLEQMVAQAKLSLVPLREKQVAWMAYQQHQRGLLAHEQEVLKLSRRNDEVEKVLMKLNKELQKSQSAFAQREDGARKARLAKQITALDNSIRSLRQEVAAAQKEVGVSIGAVESHKILLQNVMEQIESVEWRIKESNVFDLYLDVFGKNGVPRLILAKALPMLNAEINRILSNIVDFSVFLEHDDVEQTIRLYMQYGQYKRRNLSLAGGAERFIASLAVRAALLGISSLPRTNMFIVDEGFGKLDPSMLDSVQRMFDYLKSCFDHVLIVSHLDSMRDVIDNVIEIGSDSDRYAHVEVV